MKLFETKQRTPTINLAALIDILFLLIIFFVVSSKIIGETGIKLELPYHDGKSDKTPALPVLEMDAEEKIHLEGKLVGEQDLPEILRSLQKKERKKALLLNIDRKVPHGRVISLMNHVRNAGFHRLVFGTQSAKPQ